jgi:hypothetical protein
LYIVIRTRFLTEITRESYWYRETPQNPSAFYILNFHKPNPFYPFKQLIILSFENTSSLRIDNPLHIVLQAPFIIERHQLGGWKGGRKESICVFLYLIENKINRMEKVVCLNLLSYPYYIRIILKKSITNGWISQYMYNTHFLSNLERKVFAGP